jgi:predicted TIM-barrel fold metal-dependent hydrolase
MAAATRHPIISADGHIDLPCLPAGLFVDSAPAGLRDAMPKVVERRDGRYWVTAKGVELGLAGGMGSGGRRYEPGQIHRADRMAQTGLYDDQARGVMRTAIPELRVKDQDRDGVCAEVIYGILGAANRVEDAAVAEAMVRIYNDFAAEFRRAAPGRFAMLGCLCSGSPEDAARELRRCAALGLAGVELPLREAMPPLWRSDWDPVWDAAQETGLPVHLHTVGAGADRRWVEKPEHYLPFLATVLTGFQLLMSTHVAALIFGGALERFPRLNVVMGEAGLGWIPYVLERMDYEWQDQFRNIGLRLRPSEYWARQMHATFQQDEVGIALLDRIGADNVLWGSDFPHPDGIWPDSQEHLARQLGHLPEPVRRKLTCDNAARLYRLPLPAAA